VHSSAAAPLGWGCCVLQLRSCAPYANSSGRRRRRRRRKRRGSSFDVLVLSLLLGFLFVFSATWLTKLLGESFCVNRWWVPFFFVLVLGEELWNSAFGMFCVLKTGKRRSGPSI